jgi:hypothetical protein
MVKMCILEPKYKCIFKQLTLDDLFSNKKQEIYFSRSDLVVALAVVHHLKIQKISSEKFCQLLSVLTNKYILLEDIDSATEYEKNLSKLGFKLSQRLPSFPEGRTISLFEKG